MKRLALLGILVQIAAVSAGGQTANLLFVKPSSENLRTAPGGARMGELAGGSRVEVLERRKDWVRVTVTGWMYDKSLVADTTMTDGFKIHAGHILVGTEAEANQVLQELKAGASFESLARKYSKDASSAAAGGDLGEFQRGDLMPEFERAVFGLKPGGVSSPVKTELGWHVIRRAE
jgi:hypothetical protein